MAKKGFFKGLIEGFVKWQVQAASKVIGMVIPSLGTKVADFGAGTGMPDMMDQYNSLVDSFGIEIVEEAETNKRTAAFYNWIANNRLLFWVIVGGVIFLVYKIFKRKKR